MKEYTKEFYRLDIRSRHIKYIVEIIARYLNRLMTSIQKKISLVKVESIEETYQFSLKDEEKFHKRHDRRTRGRGSRFPRGRGKSYDENSRSYQEMRNYDRRKTK